MVLKKSSSSEYGRVSAKLIIANTSGFYTEKAECGATECLQPFMYYVSDIAIALKNVQENYITVADVPKGQ